MMRALFSLFMFLGTLSAVAETAAYTCVFGREYYSGGTDSYDNSDFKITCPADDGMTWQATNFSNSFMKWNYIKAGHQEYEVTATIVNMESFPEKISSFEITIDAISNFPIEPPRIGVDYVKACRLLIGHEYPVTEDNATKIIDFNPADFPESIANTPYVLTYDVPADVWDRDLFYCFAITNKPDFGKQGFIKISKLEYFEAPGRQSATMTFPAESYSVTLGDDFEAPAASGDSDGEVTYSSSNPEVAEVIDEKAHHLRLNSTGTTTVTAKSAATTRFESGITSYTLTVLPRKDPTHIDGVSANAHEPSPAEYFTPTGQRVTAPANGIYIKREGTRASKVRL